MSLGAQHSVTVDGASISYFDLGRGQPLVFVHGYFLSFRTWRKVIFPLGGDYRCIALDLLGAGSTLCSETCDLSLAGHVKMLSLFLDALELSSVALIAHDSGAMVTRQFAATFPERVTGLVLSDTEIPGYRVRSFVQAERLLRVPGLARLFEGLLGSRLLWNRPTWNGVVRMRAVPFGHQLLRARRSGVALLDAGGRRSSARHVVGASK